MCLLATLKIANAGAGYHQESQTMQTKTIKDKMTADVANLQMKPRQGHT